MMKAGRLSVKQLTDLTGGLIKAVNANSKKMLPGARQTRKAGACQKHFGKRFSIEAEGHQLCSSRPALPVAAEDSGRLGTLQLAKNSCCIGRRLARIRSLPSIGRSKAAVWQLPRPHNRSECYRATQGHRTLKGLSRL